MKGTMIEQAADRAIRRAIDEMKAELIASPAGRKVKEQQLQKYLKNQQIPQGDADKTK
jgi:hypothetical protein